jgi:hypothetical protein
VPTVVKTHVNHANAGDIERSGRGDSTHRFSLFSVTGGERLVPSIIYQYTDISKLISRLDWGAWRDPSVRSGYP